MLVLRTLPLLVLGLGTSVSALVAGVGNFDRRDGTAVVHRRYAHAARSPSPDAAPKANPAPAPISPASEGRILTRRSIAERRALRQKRCAARLGSSSIASTSSSSSTQVAATDPPVNVGNAPAPAAPTSTQQVDQSTTPQNTNPNTGGSSSGGDTYTGQLTYYDIGLGACGYTNNNGEMVAAVSHLLYDGFEGYWGANPNNNPICGRKAVIHFEGHEITVTVVDRCEGCAMWDVDLSPTAFGQVADMGRGRLDGATWRWA